VRRAANSASEAVIVTDARAIVTAMNRRAESMTGWTEADAIGQPIVDVFRLVDARTHRPVVNPLVRALYKKVVVGPSPDALLVGKDGMEWQVREKAAPIVDARGSVFAGAVAFRNVLAVLISALALTA
jgi:PAS domain S-box-containing protein